MEKQCCLPTYPIFGDASGKDNMFWPNDINC